MPSEELLAAPGGLTLAAAIEIISPGNKDRVEERRTFATKCASYLYQGISLILIDIVTSRRANLHNDTMRLMGAPEEMDLPKEVDPYGLSAGAARGPCGDRSLARHLRRGRAAADAATALDRRPVRPR